MTESLLPRGGVHGCIGDKLFPEHANVPGKDDNCRDIQKRLQLWSTVVIRDDFYSRRTCDTCTLCKAATQAVVDDALA